MIYLAQVSVEINRVEPRSKTKFYKVKKTLDMVYTDGAERKKDSFFLQCLEKDIDIKWDKKESYKITNITKIKPLGLQDNE